MSDTTQGKGDPVAPGTSMLVVWADRPVRQDTVGTLTAPGSQQLMPRFNPVEGGGPGGGLTDLAPAI